MSLSSIIMAAVHTMQIWGMWLGAQMQSLFIANPVIFGSGAGLLALGAFMGIYNFIMRRKKPNNATSEVGVGTHGDIPYDDKDDKSVVEQDTLTRDEKRNGNSASPKPPAGQTNSSQECEGGGPDSTSEGSRATTDGSGSISSDDVDLISVGSAFSDSDSEDEHDNESQQTHVLASTLPSASMHQQPFTDSDSNNDADQRRQDHNQGTDLAPQPSNQEMNQEHVRVMQEVVNTVAWHLAGEAALNGINRNTFFAFNRKASEAGHNSSYEQDHPVQRDEEEMSEHLFQDWDSRLLVENGYEALTRVRCGQLDLDYNYANQTLYSLEKGGKGKALSTMPSGFANNATCAWDGVGSHAKEFLGAGPAVVAPINLPTSSGAGLDASRLPRSSGALNQVGMFCCGLDYQRNLGPMTPAVVGVSIFVSIPLLMWRAFFVMRGAAGY